MALDQLGLLRVTADVVSAHVACSTLAEGELVSLIQAIYGTLRRLGTDTKAPPHQPSVPVDRTVFPNYIICLEDGAQLKMLKRHLKVACGVTVDEYRRKWGLPASYPMVAPSYAKRRSDIARQVGLGKKPVRRSSATVVRGTPKKSADDRR